MLEIYIKRPFFFRENFELFFIYELKTLKNEVRNEIFRQMSLTSTLPLDIPVCPMDTKEIKTKVGIKLIFFFLFIYFFFSRKSAWAWKG